MWSCGDDDQGEGGHRQQAPGKELRPLFPARPQLKEGGDTSNDEQKVGEAAEQNRERVGPVHMAGANQISIAACGTPLTWPKDR